MMRNAGVEGNHAALPSPMGDGSGQKKEVDNRKSLAYSIPNSVQTMGVRSQLANDNPHVVAVDKDLPRAG